MRRVHADEAAARDLAEGADEARSRAHRAHQAASNREAREAGHQLSALRNVQQVPKMNKRGSAARRNVQQQVRGLNKRGSAELLKGKECDWHSVSIPCPEMVSSQAACIATGMCVPVRP